MNKLFNKEILKITSKDISQISKFKYIENKPKQLYHLGNIDLINQRVFSIVGSRNCSDYGKNIALSLSYELAMNGFIISSGGARGIDSFAVKRSCFCSQTINNCLRKWNKSYIST